MSFELQLLIHSAMLLKKVEPKTYDYFFRDWIESQIKQGLDPSTGERSVIDPVVKKLIKEIPVPLESED